MKTIVLLLSAALFLPVSSRAKQTTAFSEAEALLYSRETDKAVELLSDLCENGTLRACSLLGFAYTAGRYGVKKDDLKGLYWYERCAEREKNFFCASELGRLYYRRSEYEKAYALFKKGAQADHSESQYRFARMILEGKGTHPDSEKAVRWFRKAAHAKKKPSEQARCQMVKMSYYGIGMRPSVKDTLYWLKMCDNPLVRALMSFYGHGVPKDREKARQIMTEYKLNEALDDWKDLTGEGQPTVGKKSVRDQTVPEDCFKKDLLFGTGRKDPKIETYAVKIFASDFYRSFDVRDGYAENIGGGDQTFEACGTTFYTTKENKRLLQKAVKNRAIIKINRYKNACLNAETTGFCNLNLPWSEPEEKQEDDAL